MTLVSGTRGMISSVRGLRFWFQIYNTICQGCRGSCIPASRLACCLSIVFCCVLCYPIGLLLQRLHSVCYITAFLSIGWSSLSCLSRRDLSCLWDLRICGYVCGLGVNLAGKR